MHGYSHIYDKETNKKDFFEYGGKSEFFGHSLENQSEKIKKGLEIFKNRNIKVRSFFLQITLMITTLLKHLNCLA